MSLHNQNVCSKDLTGNYRSRSFWLEGLSEVPEVAPLGGSARCDIAVIGGGFTGLSAAYNTCKLLPGADVRVLEANICGFGSSGRNAGFSSTLFGMAKSFTALRFGQKNAIAAHHYMEDAVSYLEQLVREHDINCDFERTGSTLVATTPAQVRRVDHELRVANSWKLEGIEARDAGQLRDEFHTRLYRRGMYDRRTALLNPALLTRGLLRVVKSAGALVHEMSPVTSITEKSTGFCVHTKEGVLHADRLVYATNAYSILFPRLSAKQTPVLQHIVLSEPLTEVQLESIGWNSRCGLEDARNQLHYYRLTADNRILMGGGSILPVRGPGLADDVNKKICTRLKRHVIRIYPQLSGLKFTHSWGGAVSIPVDMAPVIGYLGRKQRAIFALGLMGHGVSMAPYNGLGIAELLAGRKSKRTEMFFVGRWTIPWPPQVGRFPILQCARAWLKLEDRLRWD